MEILASGERRFLTVDRGAAAVHLRLLGRGNESVAWLTTYKLRAGRKLFCGGERARDGREPL